MMFPKFIVDALARRKARFDKLPVDQFSVRQARSCEDYENAFRLLQIGYVYQGLEPVGQRTMRMTDQHVLPEAVVLVAHDANDHMVGTISVTLDSPANLPLDEDYPDAMAALRAGNTRICEIGSFTVVRRCWNSGVALMLATAATRVAFRLLGCNAIAIGVNPKAVPFYRAVWGFQQMGADQDHHSLAAPVAGMVVSRDHLLAHVGRHFVSPVSGGATVVDHLAGDPPLPGTDLNEDAFFYGDPPKMPRQVFRKLFCEASDRISCLAGPTRRYVRKRRSDETLGRFLLAS